MLRALSWQGIEILDKLGPVDIEIRNVQRREGRITYDSGWRCRECGDRDSINAPTSDDSDGVHDDRQLICRACGVELGRWVDQRNVATYLAFFELTMREERARWRIPDLAGDAEARIRSMVETVISRSGGHPHGSSKQ